MFHNITVLTVFHYTIFHLIPHYPTKRVTNFKLQEKKVAKKVKSFTFKYVTIPQISPHIHLRTFGEKSK